MKPLILVAGASGYIAGLLVPRLLQLKYRVRCLVRDPSGLAGKEWADDVEVVIGDLLQPDTLPAVMRGVRDAYYLVHSMSSGKGYPHQDERAACNFAFAAEEAHLDHIIYLGGLADPQNLISTHMRSRVEVGGALQSGVVPVTEFRAGVIVGPGSISFEIIRFLTEQFPLLIGPPWLRNMSQPIAAENVVEYLVAALDNPECRGRVIEIGGADVMRYIDCIREYALQRGLRRRVWVVPFLPVRVLAWMVGLLTPVPFSIARPLIEGLKTPAVVYDDSGRRLFPDLQPEGYHEALVRSLNTLCPGDVKLPSGRVPVGKTLKHRGFLLMVHRQEAKGTAGQVFDRIEKMMTEGKALPPLLLWQPFGWFKRRTKKSAGGRRGKNPVMIHLDCREPGHRLRFCSEETRQGQTWLEWILEPLDGSTLLIQVLWFAPRGLLGFISWYILGPFRRVLLGRVVQQIGAGG